MTIDEAISLLKQYIDYDNPDVPDFYTMAEACEVVIKALEQEHCDDCVSRQQAIDKMQELEEEDIEAYGCSIPEGFDGKRAIEAIKALSSVHPKTKVGRWIYDKNIDNWKCSECGETPKTMGYCGSADFMTKHFKYCNHCGAKMQEVEE